MKEGSSPWSKKEFTHHQHRRKKNHDYCSICKYHITLTKSEKAPAFGNLPGRFDLSRPESIRVEKNALGILIAKYLREIPRIEPRVAVLQYILMPDHVHFLIHVKERLDRPIGYLIGTIKSYITLNWHSLAPKSIEYDIFTEGYNDKIIYKHRSLDDVFKYIKHNPYRLAVRKSRPDFFRKIRNIFIDRREIQAYGNLFLLRNPFKISLVIHRSDDENTFNAKLEECIYYAMNGGIVVSAFISKREKEIRRKVEEAGGRLILIHNRPFDEREKPMKHDFNLCCEGRILIISPIDYLSIAKSDHPSRNQCLDMNSLAETIAIGNVEIK